MLSALGALHAVWNFFAVSHPEGVIELSRLDLAIVLETDENNARKILDGMIRAKFLDVVDECVAVHNWEAHTGSVISKRRVDRIRKDENKRKKFQRIPTDSNGFQRKPEDSEHKVKSSKVNLSKQSLKEKKEPDSEKPESGPASDEPFWLEQLDQQDQKPKLRPKPTIPLPSEAREAGSRFLAYMKAQHPGDLVGTVEAVYQTKSADEFRRAVQRKEADYATIVTAINGLESGKSEFWQKNVRSPAAMFGTCKDGSRRFARILDDINGPPGRDRSISHRDIGMLKEGEEFRI